MADELPGGAPAPAETPAVVETPAEPSEPIAKAEPTPRGAIDRAFAKMEEGGDAEPASRPERARNPDGTFAANAAPEAQGKPVAAEQPKPGTEAQPKAVPLSEAPTRFSADAKAAWATVPDAVKGEVHRALREAEQGIDKYKGAASRYDQVWRPFEELATKSQMDPVATLNGYVQIDALLNKDFGKGIEAIFQRAGQDPKAWASKVMGQAPQPQDAKDQIIAELRNELKAIRNDVNGLNGAVKQSRDEGVQNQLNQWKMTLPESDRTLFDELDEEVAFELNNDPSLTLVQAFDLAKQKANARYTRMFPQAAQTRDPLPTPPAQTGKGQLSVTGAPGPGSDPAVRRTPSSARDALNRAFEQVGL